MARAPAAMAGGILAAGLLGCGGGGAHEEAPLTICICDPPGLRTVTPTNGQVTLPDLADLGGRLEVRFSEKPRTRGLLDPSNAVNGLGPDIRIVDQRLAPVRGSATIDPVTRTLTFVPAPGAMPAGQYTLTLLPSLRFVSRRRTNAFSEPFTTSWTVGPDAYAPRVLDVSPARNQVEVPRWVDVVFSFNESLDPRTVILGSSVTVEDASFDPPRPVVGTLSLRRNGFDVVFHPDACVGFPPRTLVRARLGPAVGLAAIRDHLGNPFAGATLQFETAGDAILPDPAVVPPPGSPAAGIPGTAVYAATTASVLALDAGPALADLPSGGEPRPEGVQVVDPSNPAGLPYRAAFAAPIRGATEVVVDPRRDPVTRHTFLYVLDAADRSVAIVDSGTGTIVDRLRGFRSPRGLALSGADPSGEPPAIFVSDFREGTVTRFSLRTIVPGRTICTQVKELNDDPGNRIVFPVGRGPAGIACAPDPALGLGCVCDTLDGTITVFRTRAEMPGPGDIATYPVGTAPIDCAWGAATPGIAGAFLWIACAPSAPARDGAVHLWWSGAPGGAADPSAGRFLGGVREGIRRPGRPFADPTAPARCFVPDEGGTSVAVLEVPPGSAPLFLPGPPRVARLLELGAAPSSFTMDASAGRLGFASLPGAGQVAVLDLAALPRPPVLLPLPGVLRLFSSHDP